MRKHVRPADPAATIPDPARGRDLPPDGLPCEWNTHWARLELRGDVIVTEISEPAAESSAPEPAGEDPQPAVAQDAGLPAPVEPAQADPAPDPGTVASVPFMITAANRRRLKALGKTDDEIANMKPEDAQAILNAADTPAV